MVVWDAHRVSETSSEAFILRLFRQRNKIGFIKGISDSPDSFSGGFFKVEKVMKSLFVKKLYLWPRFHVSVAKCLQDVNVDLIELKQAMGSSLAGVQNAIIDCMDACLVEIRKSNKIDCSEMTMESALLTSFDAMVRRQLAPVWNRIGVKTKQLIEDLKTLRKLLGFVAEYDCVTFLDLLDNLRASMQSDTGHPPFWMYMGAGRRLLELAKSRVYDVVDIEETERRAAEKPQKRGSKSSSKQGDVTYRGKRLCLNLQENPKWNLLRDVLEEIQTTRAQVAEAGMSKQVKLGPTLVIVSDERTASQTRDVLTYGTQACINHAFRRYCYKRLDMLRQQRPKTSAAAGRDARAGADSQRWWVERDKGIELNSAQIELRLLATRALMGGWNDVHAPGRCSDDHSNDNGPQPNVAAKVSDDCVLIEDDDDSGLGHKEGSSSVKCESKDGSEEHAGDQKKVVLERVRDEAEDDSEDDDLPLALKQQKLRLAAQAARTATPHEGSDSANSACAGRSSSSSSCSSVSCPSPTAAAEKRARITDGTMHSCNHGYEGHADEAARPPAKKGRRDDKTGMIPSGGKRDDGEDGNVGGAGNKLGSELDLEHVKALLGLADETISGWVATDLEMLAKYLSDHDTGDRALIDVARQGLLEAFVAAVYPVVFPTVSAEALLFWRACKGVEHRVERDRYSL